MRRANCAKEAAQRQPAARRGPAPSLLSDRREGPDLWNVARGHAPAGRSLPVAGRRDAVRARPRRRPGRGQEFCAAPADRGVEARARAAASARSLEGRRRPGRRQPRRRRPARALSPLRSSRRSSATAARLRRSSPTRPRMRPSIPATPPRPPPNATTRSSRRLEQERRARDEVEGHARPHHRIAAVRNAGLARRRVRPRQPRRRSRRGCGASASSRATRTRNFRSFVRDLAGLRGRARGSACSCAPCSPIAASSGSSCSPLLAFALALA